MSTKGFTLIELVVVITVMGILTTIGIMSYKNTLEESRDQKRMLNVQNIRNALDLYRSTQANSVYPDELDLLESSSYSIPVDPTTGLTEYEYYASSFDGFVCDNTNEFCNTFVLRTNLNSIGSMYEVTPNSERILEDEDVPMPTPLTMPTSTPVPTATPIPTSTPHPPTATLAPTRTPTPTPTLPPFDHSCPTLYYTDWIWLEETQTYRREVVCSDGFSTTRWMIYPTNPRVSEEF